MMNSVNSKTQQLIWVFALCLGMSASARAGQAAEPSFACNKVESGSIEALVCQDAELSKLDAELAEVYAAASQKAVNEHPPVLKAEQRGWIKGRNDCWKSDDKRQCVFDAYQLRITELQARYRLVSTTGPVTYLCDDQANHEVIVTFFSTALPSLIAENGDNVSFMTLQPSASGSKYEGRNELFWEHHGEALIVWGFGTPEIHCKPIS